VGFIQDLGEVSWVLDAVYTLDACTMHQTQTLILNPESDSFF
jgi:hypothetical protein